MAEIESEGEPQPPEPGRIARLKTRAQTLKDQGLERLETERSRRPSVRIAFDFYQRDRAFAGSLLAGGLTVKLFLWFLPFALTFVVILGSVASRLDQPPSELARDTGLTAALAGIISDAVETSERAGLYLGALGVVLMIWAGIGVMKALKLVSRLAWQMSAPPHVNQLRGSLGVVVYISALLLLNRLMNLLLGGPFLSDVLVFTLTVAILVAILISLFRSLPHPEGIPWIGMLPGALLMAIGVLATRLVTVVYFAPKLESAGDLYGGLGMAGVFLAWLYIFCRILVAAISLNATVWQKREGAEERPGEMVDLS
jgi:uncharacterized BrkB/YihY/UPF0761 family membrane protein